MKIARVAIDVPLNTYFDYSADDISADDIGRRALVPFGRRLVVGVIMEITDPLPEGEKPKYKLKPVQEILRDVPRLPKEIRELAQFCSHYYHHPLGQVLAAILPQRLRRTKAARS